MRWLVVLALVARSAAADPAGFGPPSLSPVIAPEPPPVRQRTGCSTRPYLEPSLLMLSEGGDPTVFNRIAAGALIRGCTSPI